MLALVAILKRDWYKLGNPSQAPLLVVLDYLRRAVILREVWGRSWSRRTYPQDPHQCRDVGYWEGYWMKSNEMCVHTALRDMTNKCGMQFKLQYFLTLEISKGMKILAMVFMMPQIVLPSCFVFSSSSSSSNQSDYEEESTRLSNSIIPKFLWGRFWQESENISPNKTWGHCFSDASDVSMLLET